jgi:hypothetical protein
VGLTLLPIRCAYLGFTAGSQGTELILFLPRLLGHHRYYRLLPVVIAWLTEEVLLDYSVVLEELVDYEGLRSPLGVRSLNLDMRTSKLEV